MFSIILGEHSFFLIFVCLFVVVVCVFTCCYGLLMVRA